MHKQNLIHKLIQKIFSVNKILMSIKGHNCVENFQKIAYIVYNMDLVYINIYTHFYQNSSFCSEDIEENIFVTSIKAHNSVVYIRI